jgi:ABC-type phosphate/phosphonate transport system ATPase subunit
VVDAVSSDAAPPPELRLAWSCQKWGCLPEAGAYLDQDYELLNRMTVFSNVHTTVARYRSLHGNAIHSLNDGERKMLRWLMDSGVF